MAMDLTVQSRQKFGKAVKALRRDGLIPAELYGHGLKNLHLAVPAKDFTRVFKEAGTNTVINLLIRDGRLTDSKQTNFGQEGRPAPDQSKVPALIYEVVRNYLTGDVDHVDFYQVRMDEEIKTKIPVEFLGTAPAVKDKGGILNKSITEIEVEALPGDLPHSFQIDLSTLSELNQSIYVKDIKAPNNVRILIDPETPIATITEPRAEEAVEAAPAVDVSAVKVETEEKKAEREAEKSAGGTGEKGVKGGQEEK